jgi:predicted nucleic acid-binding protein
MTVILDVSGAMEIIRRTEKAGRFSDLLKSASLRLSPDLYIPELANTLRKYYVAKIYTEEQCLQYIEAGIKLVDHFVDSKELWQEAFCEAINNNHSVYDLFYVVSARRYGGTLVTNDGPLAAICEKLQIPYCY